VDDRGGQQQIAVQPPVQLTELARQRRHRDGVLEQAAEVRVMAGACTARAARPSRSAASASSASSSAR
jgi:hypothetical protein